MSIHAVGWVFRQSIKSSADKFVLVALADNAGDTGMAFPSVETICRKTSLNRKTVIAALDRLTASGMIEDTGKRVGATKSVKVYRLTWAAEAVPISEPVPKIPEAVPFFPEAVPNLPREPSENRKRNHKGALLFPLWQKRLAAIFNRRETTVWSAKEMKAFDAACPIDEADLAAVEAYYRAERHKEKNICRRDLQTLLNNWPGETDRARAFCGRRDFKRRRGSSPAPAPTGPATDADFKRVGEVARAELERFRLRLKTPNPNGPVIDV